MPSNSYQTIRRETQAMIDGWEGTDVEFKLNCSGVDAEDFVAFANASGGTILIGVDEVDTEAGQGQGRVPDGLALETDASYAIIWDAKVRADGYSIGTDDRTIRDYIRTQSRELKRRHLRNIYYLIISSRFQEDYEDVIRMVKMETDVNELCLLDADALVAMVDARLRDPLQLTLGPDGLQRLFSTSEVLTNAKVREILG